MYSENSGLHMPQHFVQVLWDSTPDRSSLHLYYDDMRLIFEVACSADIGGKFGPPSFLDIDEREILFTVSLLRLLANVQCACIRQTELKSIIMLSNQGYSALVINPSFLDCRYSSGLCRFNRR